jgi:hypothetical protein
LPSPRHHITSHRPFIKHMVSSRSGPRAQHLRRYTSTYCIYHVPHADGYYSLAVNHGWSGIFCLGSNLIATLYSWVCVCVLDGKRITAAGVETAKPPPPLWFRYRYEHLLGSEDNGSWVWCGEDVSHCTCTSRAVAVMTQKTYK